MIHGCNFRFNTQVEATIAMHLPKNPPTICNFLMGAMAQVKYKALKDRIVGPFATADEWCSLLFAQADTRYRSGDPVETQANFPGPYVTMRIGNQYAVFCVNEYRWRRIMLNAVDIRTPEIDTGKLIEFVLS